MNSINDVMSALEQLLLDHFKSINTGDAADPFLAFEFGTPIPDETFRNPADTSRYSPALALEYLSRRANAVPSIQDRLFVETTNTVDGLYEILLRGSTPVDTESMELLGAIKRSAGAAFDSVLQGASGVSQPFRPTLCDPANWYDQSVVSNWTPISVSHKDDPAPRPVVLPTQLRQWILAPPEFRPHLGEAASVSTMRSLASLQAAPAATGRAFIKGARPRPATTVATLEPPLALVGAQSQSAQTNSVLLAALANSGPRQSAEARLNSDVILAGVEPRPSTPVPPPPLISGDEFSIDVEISIVKLRRPWLSDGLLNLNGWFVPSARKGSFSAGTGVDDQGILPVLPVACVLIRNLTVHARWSDEDQKNLANSTHLGPFGLQGRLFDQSSATLKVIGMQSVAWICDPLPLLPPADAP